MEKKIKQTPETIILLNFVCEDIQKAARLVRDSGIYTMVMPYTTPAERVLQEKPVGLIVLADQGAPAHEADLNRFWLPKPKNPSRSARKNAAATVFGNWKTLSTKLWPISVRRSGIRKWCWGFPAALIPLSWPL